MSTLFLEIFQYNILIYFKTSKDSKLSSNLPVSLLNLYLSLFLVLVE